MHVFDDKVTTVQVCYNGVASSGICVVTALIGTCSTVFRQGSVVSSHSVVRMGWVSWGSGCEKGRQVYNIYTVTETVIGKQITTSVQLRNYTDSVVTPLALFARTYTLTYRRTYYV